MILLKQKNVPELNHVAISLQVHNVMHEKQSKQLNFSTIKPILPPLYLEKKKNSGSHYFQSYLSKLKTGGSRTFIKCYIKGMLWFQLQVN